MSFRDNVKQGVRCGPGKNFLDKQCYCVVRGYCGARLWCVILGYCIGVGDGKAAKALALPLQFAATLGMNCNLLTVLSTELTYKLNMLKRISLTTPNCNYIVGNDH